MRERGRKIGTVLSYWNFLLAFMLAAASSGPAPAEGSGRDQPAQEAAGNSRPGKGQVQSADAVILSTMLADRFGVGEWGFSALVEAGGRRILFDTGARPDTVLQNARELKLDLSAVTDVILSHHHGDHVGGLLTLRRELMRKNPDALKRAYVGAGIFLNRPRQGGGDSNEALAVKTEYEALGGSFAVIERPTEIFPGAWLTGPVPRTYPERNWSLARHDPAPGRPDGRRQCPGGHVARARHRQGARDHLRLRPRRDRQHV